MRMAHVCVHLDLFRRLRQDKDERLCISRINRENQHTHDTYLYTFGFVQAPCGRIEIHFYVFFEEI